MLRILFISSFKNERKNVLKKFKKEVDNSGKVVLYYNSCVALAEVRAQRGALAQLVRATGS